MAPSRTGGMVAPPPGLSRSLRSLLLALRLGDSPVVRRDIAGTSGKWQPWSAQPPGRWASLCSERCVVDSAAPYEAGRVPSRKFFARLGTKSDAASVMRSVVDYSVEVPCSDRLGRRWVVGAVLELGPRLASRVCDWSRGLVSRRVADDHSLSALGRSPYEVGVVS
jgi:hypothetical protein